MHFHNLHSFRIYILNSIDVHQIDIYIKNKLNWFNHFLTKISLLNKSIKLEKNV